MKLLASLAATAILAACNFNPPPQKAQNAPEGPVAAPSRVETNAITSMGWGPIRIGMTRAEVISALGEDANPNALGGPDPESCEMFHPARAPEGLHVMIQHDVLTRITLEGGSGLKTDRGFGIGDGAAAIKAAYGANAHVEPHHYLGLPAEYITVWTHTGGAAVNERGWIPENTTPDARGIRYETNTDGVVTSIHAGGPSIQYVEGCS